MSRSVLVGIVLVSALLASPAALACASCSCGDPTLTAIGEEIPTARSLRVGLLSRYWGQNVVDEGATHSHQYNLRELQLDVLGSYALDERWVLALQLPIHGRQLSGGHDALSRTVVLGDVELAARAVLFRDRAFSPNHLLSAIVGLKLPTAPALRDDEGMLLDHDFQAGTGSFDPRIGLAYSFFAFPWSAHAQTSLQVPTRGFEGRRIGESVELRLGAQRQFGYGFGARLFAEGRVEQQDVVSGVREDSTGGAIAYVAPGLLWSPNARLTLEASAHVPLWAIGGPAGELPTFGLSGFFSF